MTDVKWWDGTVPKDKCNFDALVNRCEELCERFVIGNETGQGGYEHYQIRVVFKAPKELATVRNQFADVCDCIHWTKTSKNGRNFEYVKKEGKFFCSWEGALRKFALLNLNEWQSQAQEFWNNQNERQICVIQGEGNDGKSWFAKYMEATHQADVCPVTDGDPSNYIEYCQKHPCKGYIFDVPRADSIKSKKAMWRAIEQIKNGLLYDRRYTSTKTWIEPPRIIVFANDLPDRENLSADRWQIFAIRYGVLLPVTEEGAILCS